MRRLALVAVLLVVLVEVALAGPLVTVVHEGVLRGDADVVGVDAADGEVMGGLPLGVAEDRRDPEGCAPARP